MHVILKDGVAVAICVCGRRHGLALGFVIGDGVDLDSNHRL
jgi:hypothetical protein